jgi:hypothetical protein
MKALFVLAAILPVSCAAGHGSGSFRVVPASKDYLLHAPDSGETPFPQLLSRYYGSDRAALNLHPLTELKIENAYYQKGIPKRGVNGYIGTETARYRVRASGLRLVGLPTRLANAPDDQAPVHKLIDISATRYRHYRFFFEMMLNRKSGAIRGAVLLGANSPDELNRLSESLLSNPDSICAGQSPHCTVFPEACSVTLEIEITVNNLPRMVSWDTRLGTIATSPHHVNLLRISKGRLTPVELDPGDIAALRLPLFPGDRIIWD